MLCGAPTCKQRLVAAGKALLLCQLDSAAFFNAGYLSRDSPLAAVEIIGQCIRLQHIGNTITIFVIAPCRIDRHVRINKSDLCNLVYRYVVRTFKDIFHRGRGPADKDHFLAVDIAVGRYLRAKVHLVLRNIDCVIRRQIINRTAVSGVPGIGKSITLQIVGCFVPVAILRPDSIHVGVAVCIGVFTGVRSINIGNVCPRLVQHFDLRMYAALQILVILWCNDNLVQYRCCTPAYKYVRTVGKCMGFYFVVGIRCRSIMI